MFSVQMLYIDPSVATYGIQALFAVGAVVAGSIAIIVRKARKKAAEKLNLESHLETEAEVELIELIDDEEEDTAKAEEVTEEA